MALWPSVSINATSMWHPSAPAPNDLVEQSWVVLVTISSSVLCAMMHQSKLMRVSTVTFGARPRWRSPRSSGAAQGRLPVYDICETLRKRSASLGFSSSVWCKIREVRKYPTRLRRHSQGIRRC